MNIDDVVGAVKFHRQWDIIEPGIYPLKLSQYYMSDNYILRYLSFSIDISEAIWNTGKSSYDYDVFVNPDHWDFFKKDFESKLDKSHDILAKLWETKSHLESIASTANHISRYASALSNINHKYWEYNMSEDNEKNPFIPLYNKNTVWAREFLGGLPEMKVD